MKIELGSSKLTARLNRLEKDLPKKIDKALQIVASEGARNIVQRGNKGRGYLGRFAPYSPAYAKIRQKKGRQVAFVDLNDTGQMWSSLTSTLESRGVAKIYFADATANRKGYFNNKKRPFFGFNSKDKKKLLTFFETQIKL